VQSVAAGLRQLMSNVPLREQMGHNAEQLARNQFDEMKVAAGLIDFLQDILQRYPGQA